jgi:hypothetical protein
MPLIVACVAFLLTAKTQWSDRKRVLLATVVLFPALFLCHIVEKKYPDTPRTASTPSAVNNQTTTKTGDAHSGGNQSPANTGNGNSFESGSGGTGKGQREPKETK